MLPSSLFQLAFGPTHWPPVYPQEAEAGPVWLLLKLKHLVPDTVCAEEMDREAPGRVWCMADTQCKQPLPLPSHAPLNENAGQQVLSFPKITIKNCSPLSPKVLGFVGEKHQLHGNLPHTVVPFPSAAFCVSVCVRVCVWGGCGGLVGCSPGVCLLWLTARALEPGCLV